mgnify:CR=1 FL=1
MKKLIVALSAATLLTACSTNRKAEGMAQETIPSADSRDKLIAGSPSYALAHVIIYKTRADYSNLVPVTMNSERTRIVSYPAKSDIRPSAKPVALADGWYLDKRGIGQNTVFTDYTYEAYSSLEKTPSISELMEHIIDKHPLLDLRDCGTKPLTVDELNELIANSL